jgi:5-methyltetrahydropteroyltriglutamate--homocysteine methyltransferase
LNALSILGRRRVPFASVRGAVGAFSAGADCGFSSQALYTTEVHPTVVWEKCKAMRQGADIAIKKLWS